MQPPGQAVDAAARSMAAGGRRRRPLRYQSLAALVEDSQWPFLFLVSDFSYGADDYDAEGNEEQKGPPEGSETMPYIDESPTMSPQLSARSQGGGGGDSISPTPPEGLAPGVGTPAFPSGFGKRGLWGGGRQARVSWARRCLGCGTGHSALAVFGALAISFQSWMQLSLGSPPTAPAALPAASTSHLLPCLLDTLTSSSFSSSSGTGPWAGTGFLSGPGLDSDCMCDLLAVNVQTPAQQTKAGGGGWGVGGGVSCCRSIC